MAGLPTAALSTALLASLLGGCQLVFPLDEPASSCPANYESLDLGNGTHGSYRFVVEDSADQKKWVFAEADCKLDGPTSHLAVLGSQQSATAELNVVFQRALALETAAQNKADVLIGLSARKNAYRWVTDEDVPVPPAGVPWGQGDPLDPAQNLCVEIDTDTGTIVTFDCEGADAYVCECDAFPEQPANF